MSTNTNITNRKTRAWSWLYYPESDALLQFFQLIEDTHVPCIVSPLHDSDVWTDLDEQKNAEHKSGTLKKPHFHCMFIFSGPVRITQVQELLKSFGEHVPGHVEPVSSISAMTRYFVHLDNPDKFQYDSADIQAFNGASITLQKALTPEEVQQIIIDSLELCRRLHMTEYADLVDFCIAEKREWLQVVTTRTIFYRGYFASVRGNRDIAIPKRVKTDPTDD